MKNKSLLFFCLVALVFSACKKELKTITKKDDKGNIIAEYQVRAKDEAKQGTYVGFYEDGSKFEESNYVDNVLDGKRTLFYKDGQVKAQENHVKGTFAGQFTSFHPNGKKWEEGSYTNDAMNGEWKFYRPDGSLKEVILFVENEENGPFKEYHPNGKVSTEGTYKNGGNEEGELKKYDETGKLIQKMNCRILELAGEEFSKCETTWKAK